MISLIMSSFFGCAARFICFIATSRPVDVSTAVYTTPEAPSKEMNNIMLTSPYLSDFLEISVLEFWIADGDDLAESTVDLLVRDFTL